MTYATSLRVQSILPIPLLPHKGPCMAGTRGKVPNPPSAWHMCQALVGIISRENTGVGDMGVVRAYNLNQW